MYAVQINLRILNMKAIASTKGIQHKVLRSSQWINICSSKCSTVFLHTEELSLLVMYPNLTTALAHGHNKFS